MSLTFLRVESRSVTRRGDFRVHWNETLNVCVSFPSQLWVAGSRSEVIHRPLTTFTRLTIPSRGRFTELRAPDVPHNYNGWSRPCVRCRGKDSRVQLSECRSCRFRYDVAAGGGSGTGTGSFASLRTTSRCYFCTSPLPRGQQLRQHVHSRSIHAPRFLRVRNTDHFNAYLTRAIFNYHFPGTYCGQEMKREYVTFKYDCL